MQTYERARELCQQIGQTPPLSVLWGLWYFYNGRAEHRTARELGEQLLGQAGEAEIRRSTSWRIAPSATPRIISAIWWPPGLT